MTTPNLVARLFRDEGGQDLIEYVLLTAGFGIVDDRDLAASKPPSARRISPLDTNTQELWEPPPPGGGS